MSILPMELCKIEYADGINTELNGGTSNNGDCENDEKTYPDVEIDVDEVPKDEVNNDMKTEEAPGSLSGSGIYRYKCRWRGPGTCAKCNCKLNSRDGAKRHMNWKHGRDLMYQCNMCSYRVGQKYLYMSHIANGHCKDSDNTRENESKIKIFKCKYCFFETLTNQLRSHSLTVHRIKRHLHKCRYCSFMTNKVSELGQHFLTHDDLKIFSCSLCDYRTVRWQFLSRHFRFDHNSSVVKKEINLDDEKQRHSHLSSDPEFFKEIKDDEFICDQCPYLTLNLKKMNRHITRVHQKRWTVIRKDDKILNDDVRDVQLLPQDDTSNLSECKSDPQKSSKEKPQKFYCPKCEYVTLYESLLHEHLACNHTKIQKEKTVQMYNCSYCPFTSVYPHSVKRHYNNVHIKIKKACKCLSGPIEKVFICNFCDYEFKKKILLRRHLNRDHDEHRPYNCNVCDYKSATRLELAKHMRLHVF